MREVCSVFIEFMLRMIRDAILNTPEVTPEVAPEVKKMLAVLEGEMTSREIMHRLGLKDEKHFREFYRQPAIAAGFMEMRIPHKPNSRLQKHLITAKGDEYKKGAA